MLIRHNNLEFVNAQAMHALYSSTFDAPSKTSLKALKAGDQVKVCVNGERFWVVVTEVTDGIVKGIIDNDLVLQDVLKYKDIIEFPTDCIYDIID